MELFQVTIFNYVLGSLGKLAREVYVTKKQAEKWLNNIISVGEYSAPVKEYLEVLTKEGKNEESYVYGIPFAVPVVSEVRHKVVTGGEIYCMDFCKCSSYEIDFIYFKHDNRFIRAANVTMYNVEYKIAGEYRCIEDFYIEAMYKYTYALEGYKNKLESCIYLPEKEFENEKEFEDDYLHPSEVDFKYIWLYLV
ncbi:hypothetical protein [Clostridium drakei]|uniref:Uncharacterized protein n=1 Tax=Clostridium drakei TaxID=332101 RepID=A0A2U8DWG7_9CLOT|nr:hypothetical protein [Clostridium drakei]AWI06735.1 hypothetical protein B9W14_20290 [Clostridium drakei]